MILTSWSFLLALVLTSTGAPTHYVRREGRANLPRGWSPVRRADPDTVLPLRVALAQRNLENLDSYLLDVSDPVSPNYGKHWSAEKVAETFSPSEESVNVVRRWLEDEGIHRDRIRASRRGAGWLEANVTVGEAEDLLRTEYGVYGHSSGIETVASPDGYYLPENVARHVDFITPTMQFDAKVKRETHGSQIKQADNSTGAPGQPGFGPSFPKTTRQFSQKIAADDLSHCSDYISPDCLRALYSLSYNMQVPYRNSLGIVEYTPQAYLPADMWMFFQNFSTSQMGQGPIFDRIAGGVLQTQYTGFSYNGESNLDLQYAMSLVGPTQPVTLYQVGDMMIGGSFNTFLDALDGSYCTFEGGDTSWIDPQYPDNSYNDGYHGGPDCGTVKPTYVISTSYGYDESSLPADYSTRQCAEYGKLGLMGITVLYSSGDYGVGGFGNWCLWGEGNQYPIFNPSFPSGCPYVTSVGATQMNPGSDVSRPESACEQVIYSGEGFSNYFGRPSYQADAVANYLQTYPPAYESWQFNSTSRAFPDISANGANYLVAVTGSYWYVYGTSCSSPVLGAMITMINDARLAAGKGPVGFINPALYSASFADAFNDITTGTNPGCGTTGFNATPGWDPVTGLGTPDFGKMIDKFLALP